MFFILTGEHPHQLPAHKDGCHIGLSMPKAFKLNRQRIDKKKYGRETEEEGIYGRELELWMEQTQVTYLVQDIGLKLRDLPGQESGALRATLAGQLAHLSMREEELLLEIEKAKKLEWDWEERHDIDTTVERELRQAIAQQSSLDDDDDVQNNTDGDLEVDIPRYFSRQPDSGIICPHCDGSMVVYKNVKWTGHTRLGGPVKGHTRGGQLIGPYDRKGSDVAKHYRMVWRICTRCKMTFKRKEN